MALRLPEVQRARPHTSLRDCSITRRIHCSQGRFADAVLGVYNYLFRAGRSTFRCPNVIHPLIGDSYVSWPDADYMAFLNSWGWLWNNGG